MAVIFVDIRKGFIYDYYICHSSIVPNANLVDRVIWVLGVNQGAGYKSKRTLLGSYNFKLPVYQMINLIQDWVA